VSWGGKLEPERRTHDASTATALTRQEASRDEGEAARGAMRSGKARSGGRWTCREVTRRAREAVTWEATDGWGKERRAEAASLVAARRGASRESRWQKKAVTVWRCRAEEDAMVLRWPA
jgi:hypothetical protein